MISIISKRTPLIAVMLATFALLAVSPAQANIAQATKFVDGVASEALSILSSSESSSAQQTKIKALIKNNVDVKWIAKFVLGKHWRSADKAQQDAYIKHYEGFLLNSYASRFSQYKGEGYKILDSRQDKKNKYTVKMSIDVSGKPAYVDYKVRKRGSSMKIYDLSVEGVSLIATQRSEFNSIVQNQGMDYLIGRLEKKSGQ